MPLFLYTGWKPRPLFLHRLEAYATLGTQARSLGHLMLMGLLVLPFGCSDAPEFRDHAQKFSLANASRETPIDDKRDRCRAFVNRSADYLVAACGNDGRFVYRVHLDPSVPVAAKYNMLRHAGSMVAMADCQQRFPRADVLDAMERAGRYLRSQIGPVSGQPDLRALWSDPQVEQDGRQPVAKLGGTGLALVALGQLECASTGQTPLDHLRAMGRFVLWMQKDDGSYYSKCQGTPPQRDDRWTSLYYPGEAALGLIVLHERDGADARWLQAARKSLLYLARLRSGQQQVDPDHWALIATARILPMLGDGHDAARERELLMSHAKQVARSMLAERMIHPPHEALRGSWLMDGRTTPTATRLEGVLSCLTWLPRQDEALRQELGVAVEEGIDFIMRAQHLGPAHIGAMPRAFGTASGARGNQGGDGAEARGRAADRRAREVRIDYVQHALSAVLQYEALLDDGGAPAARDDNAGR